MFCAGNFAKESEDVTDKLLAIEGDLTEEEATLAVAELLDAKPALLYRLLMGEDELLFPFQSIKIGMFKHRDFCLDICSRGGGKSYTVAVFILLYAIQNPGVKILVLSATLRQAKSVLDYVIDLTKKNDAHLLRQFLTDKDYRRNPDRYSIKIGTENFGPKSEIFAMALGSGEKIRGARAQVIVLDEAFAIPKNIVDDVIGPMMVVNANISERRKIRGIEDKLIASGNMTEDERRKFKNNKMIMLSSAYYEFNPLYTRFLDYKRKIEDCKYLEECQKQEEMEGSATNSTYGIVNMGWEAFPDDLLSRSFVLEQKERLSEDSFRREYEAQFSPDSASYFKMSVMAKQTIEAGEYPHVEIVGDDKSKYFYILGIDPNFSNTETSDNYAISVLKVDRGHLNKAVLVHNYAVARLDADSTMKYLIYLLTHFNIEYITMDFAGANQSLETWNNSSLFKARNLNLGVFFSPDTDSHFDDEKGLRIAKQEYNLEAKKIVHIQHFSSRWIRESNEYLQMCFEKGKMKFASKPVESDYEYLINKADIPIHEINFRYGQKSEFKKEKEVLKNKQIDFVDHQSNLIEQTKTECANVKMIASPQGNQSFDLPPAMRKRTDPDKPRKDSYSSLLLANWGLKCYADLKATPEEEDQVWDFVPEMI